MTHKNFSRPGAGSLAEFVDSVDSFQEVLGRLTARYEDLEREYLEVNRELEETNTALQASAEQTRRFGEHLDCILQAIDVGVIAVDQAGKIQFFNPAAEACLGCTATETIGECFAERLPQIAENLQGVPPGEQREFQYCSSEAGEQHDLLVSHFPLPSQEAGQTGVYVIRDMTHIREMERTMSQLKTLAALGEMSATLAHEIRNPLMGIVGYCGLLRQHLSDGKPRKWAEQVEEGVHRLEQLIQHLLEFSKAPNLDRRPIQWRTFCQELSNALERSETSRKITLVRAFPEEWPQSQGDSPLLRQAFVNVLHNAVQAVGERENGRVEFRVETQPEKWVTFTVTDNGPGIEPEVRENIFQPFITTKEKGTGLGLSITRKIIEAHGGTVSVDSEPGNGAQFTISLPCE